MKISPFAISILASIVSKSGSAAISVKEFVRKISSSKTNESDAAAAPAEDLTKTEEASAENPLVVVKDASAAGPRRKLQNGCWSDNTPEAKWHPQYNKGWTDGYCKLTVNCDSPGYASELTCCKEAYRGQISGTCLKNLPNPPTTSPTTEGGLDVWYPDYGTSWLEATCINDRPLPSGRPTYSDMLSCCKGAYGGQVSGKCLAALPNPPTTSPTGSGGLDVWYPDYSTAWDEAVCLNNAPLPFNVGDRPLYDSLLTCCKTAYAGQMSGKCLASLPNPPTTSPTAEGGADFYYPDYETEWTKATCINKLPLPFGPGGRPTFATKEACCSSAYAGQTSNACMYEPPEPSTVKFDFEDGMNGWSLEGGTFGRQQSEFGGSWGLFSSSCVHDVCDHVTSPPIIMTSQSALSIDTSFLNDYYDDGATLTLFYDGAYHVVSPDDGRLYDIITEDDDDGIDGTRNCDVLTDGDVEVSGWTDSHWADDDDSSQYWGTSTFSPAALGLNLAPGEKKSVKIVIFHATDYEDCEYEYDDDDTQGVREYQQYAKSYFAFDNVEVTNAFQTGPELADVWYPDYSSPWDQATCLNTLPLPFASGGRPTYDTKDACCTGAYRGQTSKACCAPTCLLTDVNFDFNTGNDGWSAEGGSFTRKNEKGASGHAMFARTCVNNACDVIRSPSIMMSGKSSLSIRTSFVTNEEDHGGHVALSYNGEFHYIRPSSGRLYQFNSFDDDWNEIDGLEDSCGIFKNPGGWGADFDLDDDIFLADDWAMSTFSSKELNLPVGLDEVIEVKIYVFYGTDGASCAYLDEDTPGWFAFDDVKVTGAYLK